MADTNVLQAEIRTRAGTAEARRLRRQGRLPAVLYGHNQPTVHLSLDLAQLKAVLQHGQRVVDLNINGQMEKALIKEVQHGALGDRLMHVDLARIALHEKVRLQVPVELVGTPAGGEGQVLDHVLHRVDVECQAGQIPERLTVRVSDMKVGDTLLVRDLRVPEGVTVLAEPDAVVVQIRQAAPEKEAPAEVEPGAVEPEVIGRREAEEESEDESS